MTGNQVIVIYFIDEKHEGLIRVLGRMLFGKLYYIDDRKVAVYEIFYLLVGFAKDTGLLPEGHSE